MTKYNFFGFYVEIDKVATRDWYRQSDGWDCDCGHCRNFLVLAQGRRLPSEILEILDQFEIAPEKATYVCEMYPEDHGHCYQFNYRIAGKIIDGDETQLQQQGWGAAGCGHDPYPYGAPGFPEINFDLIFWVTLSWVLEEPDV